MEHHLKPQQKKLLDFLKEHLKSKGYPPSIREICIGTGYRSTSTVHRILDKLEEQGYIQRNPKEPRSLTVTGHKSREEELLQRIAELEAELNEYKRRYGA
ncbi:LexA family protein [Paenibacillus thailandensis]|uniref:LexA family protein n=1 Tax=Paenibacillus thailandensis TaxID=393250 RepID=A0ABW5R3G1_9BACL